MKPSETRQDSGKDNLSEEPKESSKDNLDEGFWASDGEASGALSTDGQENQRQVVMREAEEFSDGSADVSAQAQEVQESEANASSCAEDTAQNLAETERNTREEDLNHSAQNSSNLDTLDKEVPASSLWGYIPSPVGNVLSALYEYGKKQITSSELAQTFWFTDDSKVFPPVVNAKGSPLNPKNRNDEQKLEPGASSTGSKAKRKKSIHSLNKEDPAPVAGAASSSEQPLEEIIPEKHTKTGERTKALDIATAAAIANIVGLSILLFVAPSALLTTIAFALAFLGSAYALIKRDSSRSYLQLIMPRHTPAKAVIMGASLALTGVVAALGYFHVGMMASVGSSAFAFTMTSQIWSLALLIIVAGTMGIGGVARGAELIYHAIKRRYAVPETVQDVSEEDALSKTADSDVSENASHSTAAESSFKEETLTAKGLAGAFTQKVFSIDYSAADIKAAKEMWQRLGERDASASAASSSNLKHTP